MNKRKALRQIGDLPEHSNQAGIPLPIHEPSRSVKKKKSNDYKPVSCTYRIGAYMARSIQLEREV